MSFRRLLNRLFRPTHPIARQALRLESLEDRELFAVNLRVVSYNITATGGTLRDGTGLQTILRGIGDESVNGTSRPIDILALQEVSAASATAVANLLNSSYGTTVYAANTIAGASTGAGTQMLVYRTDTVQVLSAVALGSTGTSALARQEVRYQLRPVGFGTTNDIYLYNGHWKSSDSSADEARRLIEAQTIRADADSLGANANVLYVGDFNVYRSSDDGFAHLLSTGNGQAADPVNTLTWSTNTAAVRQYLTQAPSSSPPSGLTGGGLDDRFDWILPTTDLNDNVGVDYIPGTYHTFGNNGSVARDGNINDASNTALPGLANRTAVLNYLTTVTDHLPVVVDFEIISSSDTTPPVLQSFVRQTPTAATTNSDSLVFRATFSEAVQNVNTADFAITGTTATVTSVTQVSANVYDVAVSGGNLVTFNGVVGLNLASGQNIADLAGNALPNTEPVTDQTYTLDNAVPTVTITDGASGGPVAVGTVVTYTFQFNEPVTGVALGDLTNSGTAAGTFGNFVAVDADTYTVQYTTTGAGTLILRINNAGVVIEDPAGNDLVTPTTDDTTVTVNSLVTTFAVQSTTLLDGGTGFLVTFNAAYDSSALNLYTGDAGGTLDARDVQIVGPGGANFGVDANDEIRFNAVPVSPTQLALLLSGPNSVRQAGLLAAGGYTVTLQGGTGNGAFKRATDGAFLDGNANGAVTDDDDYVNSGLVAPALATSTAVFSVADVVVGPGQTADVPLVVSNDVNDVRSVTLKIATNAANGEVIGFTVNPAIPGASASFNPATGVLTVTSTSAFSTTDAPLLVGTFQLRVPGLGNPGTAPGIGNKSLLDLTVTSVTSATGQPKAFVGDDGLHLVAYLADLAPGTGAYSGTDVSSLQSLITGLTTALALYPNTDPRLVADANRDGNLNGIDVSNLQLRVTGASSSVPPLPAGASGVPLAGLDPVIFLGTAFAQDGAPADLGALTPGQQVTLPVSVFVTEPRGVSVAGATAVLRFDPSVFTFAGVTAGAIASGALGGVSFAVTAREVAPGTVVLEGAGARGPNLAFGQTETLFLVSLRVRTDATAGDSALNLAADFGSAQTVLTDNLGRRLVLIPAPTNGATDDVDAHVAVRPNAVPAPATEPIIKRSPQSPRGFELLAPEAGAPVWGAAQQPTGRRRR